MVQVDSVCLDCGEPVQVKVKDGKIESRDPEELIGFVALPFSSFTRVTACQVAAALAAYICPRGFSRKVSLSHCLGSYWDEPTISRAGLPPAGDLRLRGAPICFVGVMNVANF